MEPDPVLVSNTKEWLLRAQEGLSMQQGSDILAHAGSQPGRKHNRSKLRGRSSTRYSRGYHLQLPASTIVPKT